MIGVLYLFLSVVALRLGVGTGLCLSGICREYSLEFMSRSLWLWGALFYALVGVLSAAGRKRAALWVAVIGCISHYSLIVYGWLTGIPPCSLCWKFAAVETVLPVLLVFEKGTTRRVLFYAACSVLAVSAVLVVVNPGAGYGAPVSYAGGPRIDLPQDSLLTAGTVEEGRGKAPGDGRSDGSTRPEGEPEGGRGTGVRAVPEVSGRKTGVLVVYGPDGSQTVLNPRERPVMFVAVWCHFCAEALKALKGVPLDKRPHLVFTYLRPGDVEKAGEKLGLYGLSDQPYYLLNEPPEAVQGVPSVLTVSGDVVMGQAAVRQFLSRLL